MGNILKWWRAPPWHAIIVVAFISGASFTRVSCHKSDQTQQNHDSQCQKVVSDFLLSTSEIK